MGPPQTPSYVLGGLCDTYYCLYIVSCRDVVQLGLSLGGPTKVRAHKSFLNTKGSLQVKNKCMIV